MSDVKDIKNCWPLSEARQRCMIQNVHRMVRQKYKGSPLWSFVSEATGHGSGYSIEICKINGWDAFQPGHKPMVDRTESHSPSSDSKL